MNFLCKYFYFVRDGGPHNIETSPLIRRANQLTGSYVMGTSVMKELNSLNVSRFSASV